MNTFDLNNEFIKALCRRIPRRGERVLRIADILHIERDAAYRRLSDKVKFSNREMGLIAKTLEISLDRLMWDKDDYLWMPLQLEAPLSANSMDAVFDMIDICYDMMASSKEDVVEIGNIHSSLPLEFFLYSPVLTKFMFFKWGHYFIGSKDFDNYSKWTIPERANGLADRLQSIYNIKKIFYICDESMIWAHCKEIVYLHNIHVLDKEDVKELRHAFKDMLSKVEQTLNGAHIPLFSKAEDLSFYVCPTLLGFTSIYIQSENHICGSYQNNFMFSLIKENPENLTKLKTWIDSFRNISTLLSGSGRRERRKFFEEQQQTVDRLLG